MSEYTQCNFCSFQNVKRRAHKEGNKITLMPGGSMGGVEVFVHPADVEIEKLSEQERASWWSRWFMELPDHCCC